MWRKVWIWERKLKKGSTYCLRWYDERGRMRTKTIGPDRKLAERLRTEKEVEINRPGRAEIENISYEEHQNEELTTMHGRLAESSLTELERILRQFAEFARVTELDEVTRPVVEKYFSHRLQNVSVATANKDLRTLHASFNRAVDRNHLAENPASGIKPAPEPEREIRVLSRSEVEKLLDACLSDRWRGFVSLAVTTGLRVSEILALRWVDVDLEERTLQVRNYPGHNTKNYQNRSLPVTREVCALLRRLTRKGPYVFHTPSGEKWDNNIRRGFDRLVKRAGIPACSPHDLRRTFVSQLAMAGVNAAVVQELAGHAEISTTVKYYTGITSEAQREAASRLPFAEPIRAAGMCTECEHAADQPKSKEAAKIISLDRFRA